MSVFGIMLLLLVAAIVVIGLFIWKSYNRLITLRNRYRNSYSQIDVQMQRRYDLIPNLVETAKGYMAHERETLDAVVTARNQAMIVSGSGGGSRRPTGDAASDDG